MIPFVDLRRQHESIRGELEPVLLGAIERTDYILGEEVGAFEHEFADYCGTRRCVGVASGTAALHLGFEALGLTEGDEVIAPANTFIASVIPVMKLGARPILVDCEPDTGSVDVDQVAASITKRTKAVIGVHLHGQPVAQLAELERVCDGAGVALVEDACQAHGALYGNGRVGGFGRFAAFSFYPSKNLGALGDAGALTTNDEELADAVALLRTLGEQTKGRHVLVGWNERLDTVQAAVLRVKLRHLDKETAGRQANADRWRSLLAGTSVTMAPVPAYQTRHVYNQFVIRSAQRDRLKAYLQENGVGTEIYYPLSMHQQACFQDLGYRLGDFPESERAAAESLAIPVHSALPVADMEYISGLIAAFHG